MRFQGIRAFMAVVLACAGVSAPLRAADEAAPPVQAEATATATLIPDPTAPVPVPSSRRVVDPAEVAADVLVVRPLGIAATAVGAAIFVVALPFAAIAGDVRGTANSLVGAPARFTFKRRLGDFEARPL